VIGAIGGGQVVVAIAQCSFPKKPKSQGRRRARRRAYPPRKNPGAARGAGFSSVRRARRRFFKRPPRAAPVFQASAARGGRCANTHQEASRWL